MLPKQPQATKTTSASIIALMIMKTDGITIQFTKSLMEDFISFLDEGEWLFAKYGFITYDNKDIRYVTISREVIDSIDEYNEENAVDVILQYFFKELSNEADTYVSSISFDARFLLPAERAALKETIEIYMTDYKYIDNLSCDAEISVSK